MPIQGLTIYQASYRSINKDDKYYLSPSSFCDVIRPCKVCVDALRVSHDQDLSVVQKNSQYKLYWYCVLLLVERNLLFLLI